jgi:hypothetical protein
MKSDILRVHRSLNSSSVSSFLSERGWRKINEQSGIVSLWTIEKGNETHGALIPLNSELPDYPNRMIEALRVISEVEKVSHQDLLNTFLNGENGQDKGTVPDREMLNLRFIPASQNHKPGEFEIKKLGNILTSFQSLLDSIGSVVGKYYASSTSGRISDKVTARTRLWMTSVSSGSFVVEMASNPPSDGPTQLNAIDVIEGSLEKRTINAFLGLIETSRNGNVDELQKKLNQLQRRTTANYKKFLSEVSSSESDLDVRFRSTEPELTRSSGLTRSQIVELVRLLGKLEPQTPEVIRVDGILKSFGEINNRLTFKIESGADNTPYEGSTSLEVIEESGVEVTHGRSYRVILEMTQSLNPTSNETKTSYQLIGIAYLESDAEEEE